MTFSRYQSSSSSIFLDQSILYIRLSLSFCYLYTNAIFDESLQRGVLRLRLGGVERVLPLRDYDRDGATSTASSERGPSSGVAERQNAIAKQGSLFNPPDRLSKCCHIRTEGERVFFFFFGEDEFVSHQQYGDRQY